MKTGAKKYVIFLIVCSVLTVASLLIAFVVPIALKSTDYTVNESNTIELKATVHQVERVKSKKDYFINVNEYTCKLYLISETIIDEEALSDLERGTVIYFSIHETSKDMLSNPNYEQLAVYTLRTEDTDIINFESYYKFSDRQERSIRITSIIFALLFLSVVIFCVVKLKKVASSQRK